MTKTLRDSNTLEFKQKFVRLIDGSQGIAAIARTLGVVDETSLNWVKTDRQGKLTKALLANPVSA
ncbi:transposase [Polaromonas sp.]|uniref:transposase n=1 Tax=Polaromonas sp. TaxID=1869339 RepID=UPI0013BA9AFC|nr:transposase [Polaromonas sp.]NDP61979.1 transposase [Polaromonas sp.]